jgi:hypothetical protein
MRKTIKKFSNVLPGILSFNGFSENQLEEIEHIMSILGHGERFGQVAVNAFRQNTLRRQP